MTANTTTQYRATVEIAARTAGGRPIKFRRTVPIESDLPLEDVRTLAKGTAFMRSQPLWEIFCGETRANDLEVVDLVALPARWTPARQVEMYVLKPGNGDGGRWYTTTVVIPGDTPEADVERVAREMLADALAAERLEAVAIGVYRIAELDAANPALEPDMDDGPGAPDDEEYPDGDCLS